eukprot:scaffold15805_cov213-Isochrysis_galbana.AAC.2
MACASMEVASIVHLGMAEWTGRRGFVSCLVPTRGTKNHTGGGGRERFRGVARLRQGAEGLLRGTAPEQRRRSIHHHDRRAAQQQAALRRSIRLAAPCLWYIVTWRLPVNCHRRTHAGPAPNSVLPVG